LKIGFRGWGCSSEIECLLAYIRIWVQLSTTEKKKKRKVMAIKIFFFFPNRIIAMCGDYYIGGRRFSSLSDLIGYYSHVSCLLKGEKLLYPVAPPEASKT
jgi:hypothetical protein